MPKDNVRKRRRSAVAGAKAQGTWVDGELADCDFADCDFKDERLGKPLEIELLNRLAPERLSAGGPISLATILLGATGASRRLPEQYQ